MECPNHQELNIIVIYLFIYFFAKKGIYKISSPQASNRGGKKHLKNGYICRFLKTFKNGCICRFLKTSTKCSHLIILSNI